MAKELSQLSSKHGGRNTNHAKSDVPSESLATVWWPGAGRSVALEVLKLTRRRYCIFYLRRGILRVE